MTTRASRPRGHRVARAPGTRATPGTHPAGERLDPADLAAVAALVRELRRDAGLPALALARRSAVAPSTVYRLEAAKLRPRMSLLSAIALGIDPDRQAELLAKLAAAAGDALKAEGRGWWRYRRRRLERGILAGTTPLPSRLETALRLHREADAAWASGMALLRQPIGGPVFAFLLG
jgi:transcriptional regulator with XRE-family HTH domain